jgi:uncharacterized DUF497 family protein
VSLEFEWDARKEALNRRKHGVSFEEAATAFADPDRSPCPTRSTPSMRNASCFWDCPTGCRSRRERR